jgi:hypothetical protein
MSASSEAAASELALARIELDAGRPGPAEILSRSALAWFAAAGLRVRALAASTRDRVRLEAVARDAARAGYVELALEVKLAGARGAGARRDVARTARAKGLHRLAALATSRPR